MSLNSWPAYLVAACLFLSDRAHSAETERRLISVDGEGEVEVPADHIILALTITTEGDELLDARAANDKRATAISKVVTDQGIESQELQTANFDIAAQFDKEQGSIRYRVVRTVALSIRDIPKFEPVLAALIKQGGFKVGSISLEHSQLAKHQAEARRRAYADARQKAAQLAELDGLKLGKAWRMVVDDADTEKTPFVTSVLPSVGEAPSPRSRGEPAAFQIPPEKERAKVPAGAPHLFSAGQITVSSSVSIQFETQ